MPSPNYYQTYATATANGLARRAAREKAIADKRYERQRANALSRAGRMMAQGYRGGAANYLYSRGFTDEADQLMGRNETGRHNRAVEQNTATRDANLNAHYGRADVTAANRADEVARNNMAVNSLTRQRDANLNAHYGRADATAAARADEVARNNRAVNGLTRQRDENANQIAQGKLDLQAGENEQKRSDAQSKSAQDTRTAVMEDISTIASRLKRVPPGKRKGAAALAMQGVAAKYDNDPGVMTILNNVMNAMQKGGHALTDSDLDAFAAEVNKAHGKAIHLGSDVVANVDGEGKLIGGYSAEQQDSGGYQFRPIPIQGQPAQQGEQDGGFTPLSAQDKASAGQYAKAYKNASPEQKQQFIEWLKSKNYDPGQFGISQ